MTVRITMQFNDARQTWGESYLCNAGSDPNDFVLFQLSDALARVRSGMLGVNAGLFRVRIAALGGSRVVKSYLYNPPLAGSWTYGGTNPSYNCEFGDAALMVSSTCANGRTVNAYQAGHPAALFGTRAGDNTGLQPPADWLGKWSAWQNAINSGSFQLNFKSWTTRAQVQDLTQNAQYPNEVGIVTTNPLANVQPGQRIQLTGFKRTNPAEPTLNGIWQVHAIVTPVAGSGLTQTFLRNSAGIDPANFWSLGMAQDISSAPSTITMQQYARAAGRARGESIGLRRGRSRSRPSQRS